MMPSALTGLASRAAFNLFAGSAGPINVVISNVPGPQTPPLRERCPAAVVPPRLGRDRRQRRPQHHGLLLRRLT